MSNKIKSSKVDMIKLIINSLVVGFHICISCCSFRTSNTAAIQNHSVFTTDCALKIHHVELLVSTFPTLLGLI